MESEQTRKMEQHDDPEDCRNKARRKFGNWELMSWKGVRWSGAC